MEMKTKILDKKHLLIISIAILSIIISYFNITFAFFSDTKNQPISIKSAATFGEYTVHEPNVYIEGTLTYTTDKTNMLSVKNIEVVEPTADTYDFLLTIATQIDPRNTEYKDNEYSYISYEIYHKTSNSIDTANATCTESKYTNELGEDICNTGTYIENSLNGLPFELIKDYKITDTNTHYFDIYIYLNNETAEEKNIKTRIFYLDKGVEKEKVEEINKPNPPEIDSTGLVPIKYNETSGKWKVTTQDDPEWYDYDNQKWANAASVKSGVITESNPYPELTVPGTTSTDSDILAMFVWIPRFSYTIGCVDVNGNGDGEDDGCYGYRMNDDSDKDSGLPSQTLPGAIDIKFISKDTNETYTGDSPIYTYTSESDRNPTNYYTHPAFWWDNNNDGIREGDDTEELSGIWVGKFETSVNPSSTCYSNLSSNPSSASTNCQASKEDVTPIILPNILSLRYQNVYNVFEIAKKFTNNTIYGLTNKTVSHVMKNSEWGAVAYLSQSIYGKYGNKDYSGANKEIFINNYYKSLTAGYITGLSAGEPSKSSSKSITCRYNGINNRGSGKGGCGSGASTTGNIYGIYDMSGGAAEYVMGYYVEASPVFGGRSNGEYNDSGFTNETKPDEKYFDGYKGTIENDVKSIDLFTKAPEVIGHATAETKGWYSDQSVSITAIIPWVRRGGFYHDRSTAGVFNSFRDSGNGVLSGSTNYYASFHSVLVSIK